MAGAGSFDLTDCTFFSSLCICAVRLRICVSEVEFGRPRVGGAFCLVWRITAGVAFRILGLALFAPGVVPCELRMVVDAYRVPVGFGVVLEFPVGNFNLLLDRFTGVFSVGLAEDEASDIGGDGGVGVSEIVSFVETDFVSGGVVMSGDDAPDLGEPSKEGEFGAVRSVRSVEMVGYCRFRSLSCMMSASTLRSDSSSRNRWVSMRSVSRSFSPILISSSIMTPRSIDILYFDSTSSKEEKVFRACLSISSFCTSMSRNFSCIVRFTSRSSVISFCKAFCAAFASFFDCLYFV